MKTAPRGFTLDESWKKGKDLRNTGEQKKLVKCVGKSKLLFTINNNNELHIYKQDGTKALDKNMECLGD